MSSRILAASDVREKPERASLSRSCADERRGERARVRQRLHIRIRTDIAAPASNAPAGAGSSRRTAGEREEGRRGAGWFFFFVRYIACEPVLLNARDGTRDDDGETKMCVRGILWTRERERLISQLVECVCVWSHSECNLNKRGVKWSVLF